MITAASQRCSYIMEGAFRVAAINHHMDIYPQTFILFKFIAYNYYS